MSINIIKKKREKHIVKIACRFFFWIIHTELIVCIFKLLNTSFWDYSVIYNNLPSSDLEIRLLQ